jgi:hypothetical protein
MKIYTEHNCGVLNDCNPLFCIADVSYNNHLELEWMPDSYLLHTQQSG